MRRAIARIEQEKLDAQFARAMSEGLAAFAAEKFDTAKSAFKSALQLKPGSRDAADALAQVENRMLADRIAGHLRAAASAGASPGRQRPPTNHQSGCGSTRRLPSSSGASKRVSPMTWPT